MRSPVLKPPPSIMLVEDDANDILLFRRAFHKAFSGARLHMAENAEEAQAQLSDLDHHPDGVNGFLPNLAIVDLKLPGRSGFELLAWIRGHEALRRLPVVAFTSSQEPADIGMAYDLGVNSFVVKPAGFEALVETVGLLCRYWLRLNERPERRESASGDAGKGR